MGRAVKDRFNLNDLQKKYFINNLNKLTLYTYKLKAKPIFVTQKTMQWQIKDGQMYSTSGFDQYSFEKQISKEIVKFCKKNNIKYIDINKNLNFNKNDMYDLLHTTPTGSEKIANFIFDKLKNEIF